MEAHRQALSFSSTCAQKSRDTMSMLPAAISSCGNPIREQSSQVTVGCQDVKTVGLGTAQHAARYGRAWPPKTLLARNRRRLCFTQLLPTYASLLTTVAFISGSPPAIATSSPAAAPPAVSSEPMIQGPIYTCCEACRVLPRCWGSRGSLNSLPTARNLPAGVSALMQGFRARPATCGGTKTPICNAQWRSMS